VGRDNMTKSSILLNPCNHCRIVDACRDAHDDDEHPPCYSDPMDIIVDDIGDMCNKVADISIKNERNRVLKDLKDTIEIGLPDQQHTLDRIYLFLEKYQSIRIHEHDERHD
jgi:hypothetical protein